MAAQALVVAVNKDELAEASRDTAGERVPIGGTGGRWWFAGCLHWADGHDSVMVAARPRRLGWRDELAAHFERERVRTERVLTWLFLAVCAAAGLFLAVLAH